MTSIRAPATDNDSRSVIWLSDARDVCKIMSGGTGVREKRADVCPTTHRLVGLDEPAELVAEVCALPLLLPTLHPVLKVIEQLRHRKQK